MLPTLLSVNFTLAEFAAASHRPLTDADLPALTYFANQILQPIRRVWGPLRITSFIRPEDVGKAHESGGAVDFVPVDADLETVFQWIAVNQPAVFGRVIQERTHIHITRPGPEPWAGTGVVLREPTEGTYVLASVAPVALAGVLGGNWTFYIVAVIFAAVIFAVTTRKG